MRDLPAIIVVVGTKEPVSAERDGLLSAMGDLAPGMKLGRYELASPLGRGGMAVVWAARLRGSHGFTKAVAVKTMVPALSADPRFEKMFLDEANLASKIKHPNVCQVIDLGEERSILYLVMEWIDGASLAELRTAHGGKLPLYPALRIALDAARGLAAAHAAVGDDRKPLGLVHRDVSPENILIERSGVAKIADFGVAKATQRDGGGTGAGYVKGKVRYMAPEQVSCEPVGPRTDVFALGLVLYEAITGGNPLAAGSDVATLARIAAPEAVPDPADVPPEVASLLRRALAKDVEERFASMGEFVDALDTALEGHAHGDVAAVAELVREARIASGRARAFGEAGDDDGDPPSSALTLGTPRGRRNAVIGGGLAVAVMTSVAIWGSVRNPPPRAATLVAPNATPTPLPSATSIATSIATTTSTSTSTPSSTSTAAIAIPARPWASASPSAAAPAIAPSTTPIPAPRPSSRDVLRTRE